MTSGVGIEVTKVSMRFVNACYRGYSDMGLDVKALCDVELNGGFVLSGVMVVNGARGLYAGYPSDDEGNYAAYPTDLGLARRIEAAVLARYNEMVGGK